MLLYTNVGVKIQALTGEFMTSLTKSSFIILGMLGKADRSGYELKQLLAKNAAFYSSESNAQIYPVLKKLEAENLVTSHLDEASGARNKRIYSISKAGRAALLKWLENDFELSVYREEFLLQLSLGQFLTKSALIKKIEFYRQSVLDKLEILAQIVSHIKTVHANRPDQRFLLLTYDHIKAMLDAKMHWCDKVLQHPERYL